MYCPAKFIRDDVIAPFLQLCIVSSVTQPSSRKCNDDDADYNDDDDNNNRHHHHDYYNNVLK